ncbi:hypothetical protein PENTCL1PPCAC_15215, partial [Pristionchus entomophagus]
EIMSDLCCFGALSIMTGARILAIVIVGAVRQSIIVFSRIRLLYQDELTWFKIASVVFGIFGLIAAILVFVACEKQRAALMKPILAFCV